MIAQTALVAGIRTLKEAGVADPSRDARRLLAHTLEIDPGRLTIVLGDEISQDVHDNFANLIERRAKREPVSQIVGYRDFYGHRFLVTADVLDPRPDTEILVEEAAKLGAKTVLDIGTGSGCILLSLLAADVEMTGVGVDLSVAALEVAKANAENIGLENRCRFHRSDWFADVSGRFDLIVSNPPYIDEAEWETLEPEPRQWEPKQALTPGKDGLEPYRILAKQSPRYLNPRGVLMVEIGWKQGEDVRALFVENGFVDVQVIKDLDGRDRVVTGCLPF